MHGRNGADSGHHALTVWHYYNTDGQVATLKEMADAFEAERTRRSRSSSQYVPVDQITTKAVTAAGAKTGPDVLVFGASARTTSPRPARSSP